MPQNPADPTAADTQSAAFIARWRGVRASELSTAQSFVIGLCDWLGVAQPHATPEQDYLFERPVTFLHGNGSRSAGRIDCHKRGHFVLKSKKLKAGSHTQGFDDGLLRARSQSEGYARALPATEGRPPFVLVVDVGTVIEVYAEFSRSSGTYTPFPGPRSHRIALADLARPDIRERLRLIWSDPERLNPARISAVATSAATTAAAVIPAQAEIQSAPAAHPPKFITNQPLAPVPYALAATEKIAFFLTRCLFSMFAEDIELLPKGAFLGLLKAHRDDPATLQLFKQPHADGYSLLSLAPCWSAPRARPSATHSVPTTRRVPMWSGWLPSTPNAPKRNNKASSAGCARLSKTWHHASSKLKCY